MPNINPQIFRAYDIRGVYPSEINPEAAYRIAWGFGRYLQKNLQIALPFSVVLGLDMRGSSPFLAREVLRGLAEQGINVIEIGRVPTPAFYHVIASGPHAGGLMVTASHNPKEYNGLKLCGPKAVPIAGDSGLQEIREYAEAADAPRVGARGQVSSSPSAAADYVRRDLSFLASGQIGKFRIAVDPANAMGALYLEELFQTIPCDLIKLNWDLNGNFPVHEANPLKLETLQQLEAVIKNERADMGLATDGDGDRVAILDEEGAVIPPAIVVGLIAQELLKKYPGARIGYDVRSSRVVAEMIAEAGGEAVETPVGHSLIKKFMKDKDILFGGELSFHYYFRENFNCESPVFVIAEILLLRTILQKPLSQIWRPYLKYFHSGELNFTVRDKLAVLEKLENSYRDGQISKLDGLKVVFPEWWFNARASNTEPLLRLNLEAGTEEALKQKIAEVSALITEG